MNETGATERALMTNHEPEPQVRRRPCEYTTLATRRIVYCPWLAVYLYRMPLEHRETEDWLRPVWSNMSVSSDVTTLPPPQE
uniref:PDDEXK_1 domain-containing protein n=1 Tax=Mesocestoides corti TaxID=53468 RepID=A0A5K3G3L6_MESCO